MNGPPPAEARAECTADHARDATLALLAERAPDATVCPSEVARAMAASAATEASAGHWRDAMPLVHAAVDALMIDQRVRLSWQGKALPARAGPYRIGRGLRGDAAPGKAADANDGSDTLRAT